MTKLLFAASAAALLSIAGHAPAMAQSSTSMPMLTCKDISSMDKETARGVVFYLSGFHAASGAMQNQASSTTGSSGSGSTTGNSDTSNTAGSTDATGSTTSAGSTASGASSGASSTVMAQLPGFSTINIDKVMSDCAGSPDKQVSDVIGMGGSTAQ